MPATRDLGKRGEDIAVDYLQKHGYKILQRNFNSYFGEIDIVALDPSTDSTGSLQAGSGQVLVFVEVKTRWSKEFGLPEEAITPWKIRKIIKAGQYYKILHPKSPEALRVDAVAIELSPTGEIGETRLIKNISDY